METAATPAKSAKGKDKGKDASKKGTPNPAAAVTPSSKQENKQATPTAPKVDSEQVKAEITPGAEAQPPIGTEKTAKPEQLAVVLHAGTTREQRLQQMLKSVAFDDHHKNTQIKNEITNMSDLVHEQIMNGRVRVGNEQSRAQARTEIVKYRGQAKKVELEDRVKTMLKEDVIAKKEYDQKLKSISDNMTQIYQAVENGPEEMKALEIRLGLNPSDANDVANLAEMTKTHPVDEQQKVLEAQLLVKKLKADQKQRERNKILKEKKAMIELQKQAEVIKEQDKLNQIKIEGDLKKKRDESLIKRKTQFEERKNQETESKKQIKDILHGKPLYKVIQRNYEENVTKSALHDRKEKLKEIRDFCKPIDKTELDHWDKKYSAKKREISLKIQNDRVRSKIELKEHKEKLGWQPKLKEDDKTATPKPEENEKMVKEKKEKISNYSRYVREIFWPKVSVKKQLEMEINKIKLKNQAIRRSAADLDNADEKNEENGGDGVEKLKGPNYDRPWRDAMSRKRQLTLDQSHDGDEGSRGSPGNGGPFTAGATNLTRGHAKSTLPKIASSRDYTSFINKKSLGGNDSQARILYTDYLTEMRTKKDERGSQSVTNNNERIINQFLNDKNLNEYEKMEAVKRKAIQMEEKAKMQEKLILMDKVGAENEFQHENVERTIAVNDMYIDAIQAKLKILDQI